MATVESWHRLGGQARRLDERLTRDLASALAATDRADAGPVAPVPTVDGPAALA